MTWSKARMRPARSVLATVLAGAALCTFPALASASASALPQKVAAEDRLICHTDDPAECYPAVFRPTEEFQAIHDDQELPPGLHVRLNIYTGLKEAKINDPDEVLPEVEGLSTEQAVVVVDQDQPEQQQQQEARIPKNAPGYEAVGKIKEPEHEPGAEHAAVSFAGAVATVKEAFTTGGTGESELGDALARLEDLSHDMYYGLEIAKDTDFVKHLLCAMSSSSADPASVDAHSALQAAAILSGSLSNNPAATSEVDQNWSSIAQHKCAGDGALLHDRFYSSLVPASGENPAGRAKMRVAAVAHLLRSEAFRTDYLESGGMSQLLEVLMNPDEGKAWTAAKRRVALLVLDTFLDRDMGAETGVWPRTPRLPDARCEGGSRDEGCWDFHAARLAEANYGDWCKALRDGLAAARKDGAGAGAGHGEL